MSKGKVLNMKVIVNCLLMLIDIKFVQNTGHMHQIDHDL
jgi:hypothetical protein